MWGFIKLVLAILPIICFGLESEVEVHPEFYCMADETLFQICRTCQFINETCEIDDYYEPCKCGNIALMRDFELQGGSDCSSLDEYTGLPWCYVGPYSTCSDKQRSSYNDIGYNLWINGDIHYSYEACQQNEDIESDQIGNDWFIRDVQILNDSLPVDYGGGNFTSSSPEACQTECYERKGVCGAWSFSQKYDNGSGLCDLKSIDACCGQFKKRAKMEGFISGYVCPKCWSTAGGCPCSFDLRRSVVSTAFQIGGGEVKNMPSTAFSVEKRRPCMASRVIFVWSKRYRRWFRRKPKRFDNPKRIKCGRRRGK